MTKYVKNQCLETIETLRAAHKEIDGFIKDGQIDSAVEFLGQCQQGAITVGTAIDDSEGEGTEEVGKLEDYCEIVFRLGEELNAGNPIDITEWEKKMGACLDYVSDGVMNGFSTQKEVVFLPYKASMWDSLESVWREMDSDPEVNAVVVPIPYFDKNPDGTAREMHYEIEQFPPDVPVVNYKHYDIGAIHPDAIYIHNPYDGTNYVTSVHPDYYSSKLKEYTNELVYIPYFILGEINPSDKVAIDSLEHFVTVPGVINAHRVIVQSMNWRQVYIDVMTRYSGEQTRSYWEHKIEGSGSPKVERVRNLKATDFQLPVEWQRIVNKTNGGKKKIIFYNTSVVVMLKDGERALDKIDRTLKTFRKYADDVALLWRPHPLMEATLNAMRPMLWEKYEGLVDKYRKNAWGIYDDSPNLDRAIAISDAYYGDQSSVEWLFKETGKPIMVQNCDI